MELLKLYSDSPGTFPLPAGARARYGPFGFFAMPADRPYTTSNFVMGLDGIASFRELPGRSGGQEVSRSPEDRWLMDFYRAHHDAQIIGARTLKDEAGPDGRGFDYRIEDAELLRYRTEVLKLPRQKVLIVSAACELDLHYNIFRSGAVDACIVTTEAGAMCVAPQVAAHPNPPRVITVGSTGLVDLKLMMGRLREEGITTLLCEGGPTLYGQLLAAGLIDEDFRTLSLQVPGQSTSATVVRPTAYGWTSFLPETAPWFRLVSLHAALPHHLFLRMRYDGPRV